jgi:hypothetical protein
MAVGFGYQPERDDRASEKSGYPVYKDVVFFKCVTPGDTKSVHFQPAKDSDKQRFPRAWAAFQERDSKPTQGLPIEAWPQITRAQAMTLRAMHIHTVESLAEVHDGNVGVMGQQGLELRAKARAFVAQAKDTAASSAFAAENERLNSELAESRRQIAALATRLENIERGEPRRGPGRPRKEEAAA